MGNHGAQGHCPPGANSLRDKVSCLISSSEEWSLGSPRAGPQCRGGLWREAGSGPLVWAVKVRWPGGLSGRGTARRKEEKKIAPETQVPSPLAEPPKGPGGWVPACPSGSSENSLQGQSSRERRRTCSLPLLRASSLFLRPLHFLFPSCCLSLQLLPAPQAGDPATPSSLHPLRLLSQGRGHPAGSLMH